MTTSQSRVRTRISRSDDPRAVRTRARLVEAFGDLAVSGDRLSVAQVIERSGVNRTTFYSHYSGVEALAVEALSEFFDIVGSYDSAERGHGRDAQISERSLEEVAEFVSRRRALYAPLLERSVFGAAVEDAFAERNRATLRAMPSLPSHVHVETTARYVAAGVLGVLGEWLRMGATEAPQVVALRLAAVLPSWFTTNT